MNCILITGTSLAAQPSRDAILYSLEYCQELIIFLSLWILITDLILGSHNNQAKEIYNKAAEKCSGNNRQ